MAAPMRSALRSTARPLSVSTTCTPRLMTVFSPAKAQVQAQPLAIDTLPPPDLNETSHKKPSDQSQDGQPKSSNAFFDTTGVLWVGTGGEEPPDPNKAKLGKSEYYYQC